MQVFGKLCPLMGMGVGLRLEVRAAPTFGRSSLEKMYTGSGRDNKKVLGEIAGFFLLGFACNFAVWVLISGLRVLSDSWVFRVLICAEAVIGFGGRSCS